MDFVSLRMYDDSGEDISVEIDTGYVRANFSGTWVRLTPAQSEHLGRHLLAAATIARDKP